MQKGETASSGVVRISGAGSTSGVQKVVTKTAPMVAAATTTTIKSNTIRQNIVPKPIVTAKPAINRNINTTIRPAPSAITTPGPNTITTNKKIISQRAAAMTATLQQQQQQRTSLSPNTAPKALISRVVSKSSPTAVTPTTTKTQKAVQEEKLAALTRHGDLKITRKQLPAASVSFFFKPEVLMP